MALSSEGELREKGKGDGEHKASGFRAEDFLWNLHLHCPEPHQEI